MNNIYILTFGGGTNYGSCLQATALCKEFNELGYDVSIVTRFAVGSVFIRHPQLFLVRIINKFHSGIREKFFNSVPYKVSSERKQRLELYECEHTKTIDIINNKQWNNIVKNNGIFVVGSDIIWQPTLGYPGRNFLDFAYYYGLKMFSYASSFGSKHLPEKYYPLYRKYLSAYVGVSVREKTAAKMLGDITGIDIKNVVDPTLLLERKDWNVFSQKAVLSVDVPPKYILCYFVMEESRYWQYIRKVYHYTKIPVIVLPMHFSDETQPYIIVKDGTPYEFIWLIKNAEMIFTDSFHACVFSTIYEKEFYLLRRSRKDEDAKYDDFLTRYDLTSRQINDESVFNREPHINYETARVNIAKDRRYSIEYIKSCLGRN